MTSEVVTETGSFYLLLKTRINGGESFENIPVNLEREGHRVPRKIKYDDKT